MIPPNPLYQALVEALESQLPPRLVSSVLREGLAMAEVTPANLTHASAEAVLKGPVFRQLQTGGRTREVARQLVAEVKAYLQATVPPEPEPDGEATNEAGPSFGSDAAAATASEPSAEAPAEPTLAPAGDAATSAALAELRTALRPLNIYFSWAEVRKLRSLAQLAEDEARAGGDAASPLAEAATQLHLVQQKLEDHLVLQARTLADLEAVLATVMQLGTPAVRRLDALVTTVREAQARRMLVEAEAERAEKLARELRKLVESTVLSDGALPDLGRGDGRPRAPEPAPIPDRPAAEPSPAAAPPRPGDAEDRLRALDVEGETRDLEALLGRHAELLRHLPALAGAVPPLRAEHAAGRAVGARLADLDAQWSAQADARRQSLAAEFGAMRAELESLPAEIDATDLRRSLTVALDVLQDALPAIEDVATVRELHGVAVARRAEAERREHERAARHHEHRVQLERALERLEAAWRGSAGQPRLTAARGRLREFLDAPVPALETDDRTAALLEAANDTEAAWERAVADASDDQSQRWRARARELTARLAQLPDVAGLRARTHAVRAEIHDAEARGGLDGDQVRVLAHLVDQLIAEARTAIANRLDQVAREAGEPAPEALLRALQLAARQLDDGGFPSLDEVEREVLATRDERRAGTRRRYLRARQEAHRLADAGVAAAGGLAALVTGARAAIDVDDGGDAAVERLERHLALVEGQVAERLAGFESRLDAALASFRSVSRLNNDDVAAVRRVLQHLDGQRGAVRRVSPGLQAQLFDALTEAEAKLDGLRTVYEATRAIADQLVSGNRIDDLLGSFDALFGDDASTEPADDVPRTSGPFGPQGPTAGRDLSAWLEGYLALEAVDGAVVVGPTGRLVAGRTPDGTDLAGLEGAIATTLGAWTALGRSLGDGPPELARLELGGRPAWVAPLEEQGCALVWSHEVVDGGELGARLRDDRKALLTLLRDGFGAAPGGPG